MKRNTILAFVAVCAVMAGTGATGQTNTWQEQQRRQQQEQIRQQQQEQARRQQERDRQAQMEQARREEQARQTRTQQDQARRQTEAARQAQQAGRPAPGGTSQAIQNRTSDRMVFSNGVAKLTRPLTNEEVKRGFTGKLTSDGRALVKFQGRVFAVPASRVGGRPLLSTSSPTALASTWSPQKQASISSEVQKLATAPLSLSSKPSDVRTSGTQIHSREIEARSARAAIGKTTAAKWFNGDGRPKWPLNGGFTDDKTREEPLRPGMVIDRYTTIDDIGADKGEYFAPQGTPFEMRALPESYRSNPKVKYEVLKELPVTSGTSAPWFDQPGGGKQFKSNRNAEDLVRLGYLRKVE